MELIHLVHDQLILNEDWDTIIKFRRVFKLRPKRVKNIYPSPSNWWDLNYVNRHKHLIFRQGNCRCIILLETCICKWCLMGAHGLCNLGEADYE